MVASPILRLALSLLLASVIVGLAGAYVHRRAAQLARLGLRAGQCSVALCLELGAPLLEPRVEAKRRDAVVAVVALDGGS